MGTARPQVEPASTSKIAAPTANNEVLRVINGSGKARERRA